MLSAASCNKWWMEEILKTADFDGEQKQIEKLGENHVFFLPYLMGERSPHNDPFARATFTGITMDTTRADMTQAVLEGVIFGLEVAKTLGISPEVTRMCGGGAKSPLWRKMTASILNKKVEILENEEGPAMGGALLAAVGCGQWPDVETAAAQTVKVAYTEEPDPELAEKYEKRYRQFQKLYPALKDVFPELVC